uniref:OmpA family protein n=1 Tax=Thaumasiovibrio occultus TaxID=1891184 RepID=UPI00131B7F39|nr:OmpA family protein [Thaumasiovibrio occultus]
MMNKLLILVLASVITVGCSSYDSIDRYQAADQSQDLHDEDNDGVINARDNCASTPINAVVDNDGCPTEKETSEQYKLQVLFANGKYDIPPAFLREIKAMADFLLAHQEAALELQGYASVTGNTTQNLQLSKNRAEAVREQLIRFGVQPNRLTIVGHGDSNPVEMNNEDVGHALSRRVVGTVVGYNQDLEREWTIFDRRSL